MRCRSWPSARRSSRSGSTGASPRFLSVYDEHEDYDHLLGTIVMVSGTILALGAALVVVAVYLLQGWIVELERDQTQAISLLLILILLAPIQALDDVLTSLMSVFASPQSIFFRKYVLGPGLRLAVVLLLIAGGSGVGFLAVGYVAAGAFGIALYVAILWQVLGRRGHDRPVPDVEDPDAGARDPRCSRSRC